MNFPASFMQAVLTDRNWQTENSETQKEILNSFNAVKLCIPHSDIHSDMLNKGIDRIHSILGTQYSIKICHCLGMRIDAM